MKVAYFVLVLVALCSVVRAEGYPLKIISVDDACKFTVAFEADENSTFQVKLAGVKMPDTKDVQTAAKKAVEAASKKKGLTGEPLEGQVDDDDCPLIVIKTGEGKYDDLACSLLSKGLGTYDSAEIENPLYKKAQETAKKFKRGIWGSEGSGSTANSKDRKSEYEASCNGINVKLGSVFYSNIMFKDSSISDPDMYYLDGGMAGRPSIAFDIYVMNTDKTKKRSYETWSNYSKLNDKCDAVLVDEYGNNYRAIKSRGVLLHYSGNLCLKLPYNTPIGDRLFFEMPLESAKTLTLTLRGDNVDFDNNITFTIPVAKIKKPKGLAGAPVMFGIEGL